MILKTRLIPKVLQIGDPNHSQRMIDYSLAKQSLSPVVKVGRTIKETAFISLGVLSAGFGLKGFLLPNGVLDGGVTGISLLVSALSKYPLSILIILINLPFIVLGYFQIGKSFVFKSIIAIVSLAIVLEGIDYPVITTDKLLVAVFGGFFLGAGIGLSVRGGAVLDGTEVLAIYLSKKLGLTIGDLILIFNLFIFSSAAYFLSIEVALYSILTYIAASKTVDFVVEGVEEYIGITIISERSEDIRIMILEKMERGATIYNGKRGFARRGEKLSKTDIIYTVITRLEIAKFRKEIRKIDPVAFIVMNSVRDIIGGVIKKRQFK